MLCVHVQAQGGLRAIFWVMEPITTAFDGVESHCGIAYDQDLNGRLFFGVPARISTGTSSTMVNYRSAYHFSDNERTSFYMGPNIGLRTFGSGGPGAQLPVGFRSDVRGGLQGFFADLYMGGHYNLGTTGLVTTENHGVRDLRKMSFTVGVDVGGGWAGNSSRR